MRWWGCSGNADEWVRRFDDGQAVSSGSAIGSVKTHAAAEALLMAMVWVLRKWR